MVVLTLFFLFASLEKMGALDWNKIVHQHQGWRLISCIWLHAGLIHLVVNMLSLLFIGIRLEQQFGFGKFFFKKKEKSSYANIDPTIYFQLDVPIIRPSW